MDALVGELAFHGPPEGTDRVCHYKVITHDARLGVRGLGVCGAEPGYGR